VGGACNRWVVCCVGGLVVVLMWLSFFLPGHPDIPGQPKLPFFSQPVVTGGSVYPFYVCSTVSRVGAEDRAGGRGCLFPQGGRGVGERGEVAASLGSARDPCCVHGDGRCSTGRRAGGGGCLLLPLLPLVALGCREWRGERGSGFTCTARRPLCAGGRCVSLLSRPLTRVGGEGCLWARGGCGVVRRWVKPF